MDGPIRKTSLYHFSVQDFDRSLRLDTSTLPSALQIYSFTVTKSAISIYATKSAKTGSLPLANSEAFLGFVLAKCDQHFLGFSPFIVDRSFPEILRCTLPTKSFSLLKEREREKGDYSVRLHKLNSITLFILLQMVTLRENSGQS